MAPEFRVFHLYLSPSQACFALSCGMVEHSLTSERKRNLSTAKVRGKDAGKIVRFECTEVDAIINSRCHLLWSPLFLWGISSIREIASTTKQFCDYVFSNDGTKNRREIIYLLTGVQIYGGATAANRAVKFGRTTSRLIEGMIVKFLRSMQLFQVLNCIWRTRGIEGRIEAVVNQPRGWIFHPPIRGELGHERKTNVREYTQRDFDSARGAIEQLPDHLSISSESAPVCLGESVHRVLLASPNRSQVKAFSPSHPPSFYSFLSLLFFIQFFFSSRCTTVE